MKGGFKCVFCSICRQREALNVDYVVSVNKQKRGTEMLNSGFIEL